MTAEMMPYDRRAWAEVERWREKRLTARARRVIPQKVRDRVVGRGPHREGQVRHPAGRR